MSKGEVNYWQRRLRRGYSRRRILQGSGVAGVGLAATALVGCGDDDDGGGGDATPTSGSAQATPTNTAVSTPTATPAVSEVKRGGRMNYRSGAVRSLDPHIDTWPSCSAFVGNVFNALLKFTPDFTEIVPDIATGLPEIPDASKYIIKIRQDVTWQDVEPVNGRAFTAEDAKWSIERQMTDEAGKFQHAYFFLGFVDSLETPDNETLVFNMAKAYAPMMSYLASPWTLMVNRESVEKYTDLVDNPRAGTGPFIFDGWEKDVSVKLKANPNYWKKDQFGDALPYIDAATMHIVLDPETAATLLIDGTLDAHIAGVNQKDRILEGRGDDLRYEIVPGQYWRQFRMPPTMEDQPYEPPFDDIRVRQAIVQSIDKQSILDFVYSGDGLITWGPILPIYPPWALTEDEEPAGAKFDLDAAKALMEEAGNPTVKGPLMWATGSTEADQIGEILKQQMDKIGVDAQLDPMEVASYYDKTYKYKYFMSHHVPLNNPDPDENLSSYFGRNARYYKHWNPDIFDIIDKQAEELDPEARNVIVHDAQKMIIEDYPMKFMFTTNYHEFAAKRVKNWFWERDLYRNTLEGLWLDA